MTRNRIWILAGAVAALGALAALGCDPSMYDPRAFDDLADTTWVHSTTAPDRVGTGDYGVALAGGQAEEGARLLVAARSPDGFAHLRYTPDGTLDVQSTAIAEVNTLDQANILPDPLVMVGDPLSALAAVGMSNGGSPAMPSQATVATMDADTSETRALFSLPGPELIRDLAFGTTSVAGSGARNIAVVRGSELTVIADIDDPAATELPTCRHDGERGAGVVLANLDPSDEVDEIAFAVATDGSAGKVHVVSGSLVSDAALTAVPPDPADCFDPVLRQPLATLDAPAGESDFGAELLAADLDGTGAPELIVSAPGASAVYVYLDVDVGAGVAAPLEVPVPADAGGFGATLAAGDLDGDGVAELVIGAPLSDTGELNAGAVYVYDLIDGGFSEPVVLFDAQAEAEQRFGRAVAVVPFGPERSILVVGADAEVFTYFRTPISDDVRQAP